jgi:hypothetical protein
VRLATLQGLEAAGGHRIGHHFAELCTQVPALHGACWLQTCSAETTLDDLVQLFVHGGHRIVHVLDAVQACIASVTLDDVINELLRF